MFKISKNKIEVQVPDTWCNKYFGQPKYLLIYITAICKALQQKHTFQHCAFLSAFTSYSQSYLKPLPEIGKMGVGGVDITRGDVLSSK
jgi:hypothetical protein